jgi:hypothetical protein
VYRGEEQLIVEKDGLPVAVILSNADFQEYQRLLAAQHLDQLNRGLNREIRRQGLSEEQALDELTHTKREVFTERYGRATSKRRQAR